MATPGANNDAEKVLYERQNRVIHKARQALCMSLNDCRELARSISGEPSISGLSLKERWQLIEILRAKGAKVYNPRVPSEHFFSKPEGRKNPKDVYPERLAFWNERFPRQRPGYATNKQLAWIEALWILDFNDDRPGSGLRGFIFRQTRNVQGGPVSDLAFLKDAHVEAVMGPLLKRAKSKI